MPYVVGRMLCCPSVEFHRERERENKCVTVSDHIEEEVVSAIYNSSNKLKKAVRFVLLAHYFIFSNNKC